MSPNTCHCLHFHVPDRVNLVRGGLVHLPSSLIYTGVYKITGRLWGWGLGGWPWGRSDGVCGWLRIHVERGSGVVCSTFQNKTILYIQQNSLLV